MKRFAICIVSSLLCLVSCYEAEQTPDLEESCRYVRVGMNISQGSEDSKSVVTSEVEEFHSAILYALNPSSGRIITYDSNAGELSGTPVWISTSSEYFSWPLPENKAMDIYCIVNPPAGLEDDIQAARVTKQLLESHYFSCDGHIGLQALESSGSGLPLAGIKSVKAGEITTDDAFLSVNVSHLFAKYSFSLDLSGLGEGESLTVNKLAVNSGNTRVPYFITDFKQTDDSYLTDCDYASSSQLEQLSKGGEGNSVDIYVLENCHGTHSGAESWWTVYKDLHQSWPEISQCTFIQLSYSITGADGEINSYLSRVYLGAADMLGDFNVRRNLYKNVRIRIGRRTAETDPCFQFGQDEYYIGSGNVETVAYYSNIYTQTSRETLPDVWITTSAGLPTSDISVTGNDPSTGEVQLRASTSCIEGTDYWINGGRREAFYWPPYGSAASPFQQRRKLTIVHKNSLTFDTPAGDYYPYQQVNYLSKERYSRSIATKMAQSLIIKTIRGRVDNRFTDIGVSVVDGEYAVRVTLVPDRPGEIGFTAGYGVAKLQATSGSVTVLKPMLTAPQDNYHVDALGNPVSVTWIMTAADGTPLQNPVSEGVFSIAKKDRYGTGLAASITGHDSGQYSVSTGLRVESFAGLPGFDEDHYTFNGITVEVCGTYTYPSGYSVDKSVQITIDNPLTGYSYDGKVCEYALRQGRSAQPEYVSVNRTEYKPENLMTWPQRTFSVDLTRGGTRPCKGLEVWTDHSCNISLNAFSPGTGRISGIQENMKQWGPVYYGKRLTNIVSGEKKSFIHSVIRVYCHYNVFASFDVQEKNKVKVNWDDLGNINWNPFTILNYHFGSFRAGLKVNFNNGEYFYEMIPLLEKDISTSTRVKPVLEGFSLDTGGKQPSHGTYSAGVHNNYQCYVSGSRSYMVGYWECPSVPDRYDIDYDWMYVNGTDDHADMISWRVVAANNTPWYTVGKGGYVKNGKYITPVQKNSDGEYCFNVIPEGDNERDFTDSEGYGYQRIALFWEGKEGKVTVRSKDLHPFTSYSADLCIVNGWYDPTPYNNGLPVLANKVGMYFFPESESSNTRSGYPPYYANDWPYSLGSIHGSMEIDIFSHLEFGDLLARDRDAAR
ncbi:MAG: hypothetical protein J5835_06645 [Bacteroidales bacterium]|nr:hypothetical protein [Bacteroidales bacterium]